MFTGIGTLRYACTPSEPSTGMLNVVDAELNASTGGGGRRPGGCRGGGGSTTARSGRRTSAPTPGGRVRPARPAPDTPGDDHPSGHRGRVADQPGPRTAQRGDRRHDVGERRAAPTTAAAPRGRPERRPQRLRVAVAQRRPAVVHPAGRELGAVGDRAPAAAALDRAQQRDVLEHLGAHRRVTAGAPVGGRVDDEQLAVRGGQRRPRASARRRRSGSVVSHDHCSSGCTSRSAERLGDLAGVRRQRRSSPRQRSSATVAATACGASTTSASTNTSTAVRVCARSARVGQLLAGPRLAPPAVRQRPRRSSSRTRGRRPRPGVRRRAVPSVEPSSSTRTRRSGTPVWRQQRPQARLDAGAPRREPAAARRPLSATGGGSAGGVRSRRRFHTACAVRPRERASARRRAPAVDRRPGSRPGLPQRPRRRAAPRSPIATPPASATDVGAEPEDVADDVADPGPDQQRRRHGSRCRGPRGQRSRRARASSRTPTPSQPAKLVSGTPCRRRAATASGRPSASARRRPSAGRGTRPSRPARTHRRQQYPAPGQAPGREQHGVGHHRPGQRHDDGHVEQLRAERVGVGVVAERHAGAHADRLGREARRPR